jgi:two-component system sensor histidine kinase UhpB
MPIRKALLRIRQRFSRLSIYHQIVIGNSIIIFFGAIIGTLLTRHLTGIAADVWLIVLFATIGTALTVLINGWVIKSALHPLAELSNMVNEMDIEVAELDDHSFKDTDPDISALANGLQSLLLQLDERNRQLQALSGRAIHAQEEERIRIARSLHDETGQALSTMIINLERLQNNLPEDNQHLMLSLTAMRDLATKSLEELRKTIYGLRPTVLDDLGLVPAIRWYARTNLEEAGIRVIVSAPEDFPTLSPELTTTLFRIAQEAVNNIIKHSDAQSAIISLTKKVNKICLFIEDDGHGFNVAQASEEAYTLQHWGLVGIRERAELMGGEIDISSQYDKGTQLEVTMPL